MSRSLLLVVGFVVFVTGVSAIVSEGCAEPVMLDMTRVVVPGDDAEILLQIRDSDIHSLQDALATLSVVMIRQPRRGTVIAGPEIVGFIAPDCILVRLLFRTCETFRGEDTLVVEVVDAAGASAMSAVVLRASEADDRMKLSGIWSAAIGFRSSTGLRIDSTGFVVSLLRERCAYQLKASFTGRGAEGRTGECSFDDLSLETRLDFDRVSFRSTLSFDPEAAASSDAFRYWSVAARVPLPAANVEHVFYLDGVPQDSYHVTTVETEVGRADIATSVRFDRGTDCSFAFAHWKTSVNWEWCDVALGVDLIMTDGGFGGCTFAASGLSLPIVPWMGSLGTLGVAIDLDLVDGKSMSAALEWQPMSYGCIELLSDLSFGGSAGSIDGEMLYGLRIRCDVPGSSGDVSFVSATSLDPAYNSTVTGQTDYFELIRISGSLASCCGRPGSWNIATYFCTSSDKLFDWGMTLARADVVFSDHVTFNLATIVRSGHFGDPRLELTVGWVVRW